MDTGTHVGRLRMRGAERDVPALRLAVSSQVGGADIHPRGVPPASILVVKHFPDPLPGRLGPGRGVPWPDPEWEQAAREKLTALYPRAIRPRRGRVPFGAEAVLFADEAERLACLALDLARGGRGERWCWRAVLRETRAADLPSLLIGRARSLPAIFTLLARWDEAVSVAGALGASDVRRVVEEMVRVHGLSSDLLPSDLLPRELGHGDEEGFSSSPAPWRRLLPASPVLSKAQEHLLGLSLVLQESPARARSWRFVTEARRWWRGSEPGAPAAAERPGREEETAAGSSPIPGEEQPSGEDLFAEPPPARALTSPALLSQPPVPPPGEEGDRFDPPQPRSFLPGSGGGALSRGADGRLGEGRGEGSWEGAPGAHPSQPEPWAFPEEGLPTHLGGILYLINLIELLGLLDRFEAEEPGLAERVGAWGFLEMLGRALLGPLGEDHADDPLWSALAELAGCAPADRLDPDLSPWLGSVLPEVRGHLADALTVEPAEVAETLLLCPGRLYVTSSHVDLVAGLDRISLPVRRAGLDRDPGWLPRFGRVVLFHFE